MGCRITELREGNLRLGTMDSWAITQRHGYMRWISRLQLFYSGGAMCNRSTALGLYVSSIENPRFQTELSCTPRKLQVAQFTIAILLDLVKCMRKC
jgi:hypothetical protein